MDSNTLYIILGALGLITIILVVMVIYMNVRLGKLLGKTGAKNIEERIQNLTSEIKELRDFEKNTENYLENSEGRLRKSIRGIHTIRFNPFKGTGSGGNQSFATAFVNEEGDGVILSSLYTREHVSIFSKPIKKHLSEFELTGEEKEALSKAKESIGKK